MVGLLDKTTLFDPVVVIACILAVDELVLPNIVLVGIF